MSGITMMVIALVVLGGAYLLYGRYLENERYRVLWQCINTLSPVDREIVTLHYFSELPLQEVARLVGKSYPAVRQRLSRLRQILKQRMEEQGYVF